MSHYLVGVVVNDISEVDDILAPYDENMEVEPYVYRTKAQIIADGKARKEKYAKADFKLNDYMRKYLGATTDEEFYKLETDGIDNEDLDKDGNELSTYNPKSKWDWYSIGGRWDDGENVVQIKDFKLYDDLDDDTIALYKRAWDSFEGKSKLSEEDTKAIFGEFRMWNDKYYLDRYGTCENYIKAISSNIPYAFVDANGWYEKGQMGWWGMDNATSDSIDNYTTFAEKYFTAEENQNKYIVWVDCHI